MEWLLWVVLGIVLVFCLVIFRGAPYVPSHAKFARKSLQQLYELSEKDTLVDLGSGDGIVLRIASGLGATAIGYELNPFLVAVSQLFSRGDNRVTVKAADYWRIHLPTETTIVYVFAVSRDMKKLHRTMQHWANDVDHDLWLMTYGAKIVGLEPVRSLDAHTLYRFQPEALQRPQA